MQESSAIHQLFSFVTLTIETYPEYLVTLTYYQSSLNLCISICLTWWCAQKLWVNGKLWVYNISPGITVQRFRVTTVAKELFKTKYPSYSKNWATFTLSTLWADSADNKLMVFFVFFSESGSDISNPLFCGKQENDFKINFEIITQHAKC